MGRGVGIGVIFASTMKSHHFDSCKQASKLGFRGANDHDSI